MLPLIVLTVLVRVGQVLITVSHLDEQRLRNRLRAGYQQRLLASIAALTPQRLADPGTSAPIQACRDALVDLGWMVNAVVQTVAGAVAAVTLRPAVWRISPLAALLVVASLLPNLAVFVWEPKMQHREFVPWARPNGWPATPPNNSSPNAPPPSAGFAAGDLMAIAPKLGAYRVLDEANSASANGGSGAPTP